MGKSVKILYIIGFIFSFLVLILSILFMISDRVEELEIIREIYKRLDFNTSAKYTTIICMANSILMIITIILNPLKKVYAIIILILSILTFNLFGFIGSIIYLTEISRLNRVRIEKERQIRELNNPENYNTKKERKLALRLEPTKTDLVFLYLGIILASILIFAYCFVMLYYSKEIWDFFMPDVNGPELLGLLLFIMIYAIILFILFLIPIVYLVINIVLTAITISKKRVTLARILSIYGFIGLTIFNAIASIKMLKRFKKKIEEEKKAQSSN